MMKIVSTANCSRAWWLCATMIVGISSVFAADTGADSSTAAQASTPKDASKKDASDKKMDLDEVVVTGSHLRKDEYTSASPIQIISRDESVLAGLTTTTETLQGSTVSGGGNQINSYFGGYVTDGGPGANTLSLRGLGAVRTLVLLNGRRLAPAGSRGSVGSADLNVLPNAIVDRIEILKDGASSVYGSDAVAGVVNIITKKGINDITFEGNLMQPFESGGASYQASLVGGYSSDRGQIVGSVEYYDRKQLSIGQRDWAKCPTQVLVYPDGTDGGSILDPTTGQPKCYPIGLTGTNAIANNYIVAPMLDDTFSTFAGNRWTPDPSSTGPLAGWRNVDSPAQRSGFDPRMLNDSLVSPTRNITAFVSGSYDLHALGNAEAYMELLYERRDSEQIGTRQLDLDYQLGPNFENHPFVPDNIYDQGLGVAYNPYGDIVIARALAIWGNDTSKQTGSFVRVIAGLRGDLPFGDWQYDGYAVTNHSGFSYTFESFLNDRIYNSLYVTQVASGFSGPTRVGFDGLTYTCSVNVASPGTGCVPAPLLDANLLSGNIDDAYRGYVWQPVTGHTAYDESTISASFNGTLFKLPYGRLSAAIGAEYRTMRLNDTPPEDMINSNLYNFTSAGITKGKDAVRELFTELEAPVVRGLKGAEDLTLNFSGRYTDYNSYGSDRTYKFGLNYSPVKWFKLRSTKGTSFRAPAIFEQYLSPTSGFVSGDNDPCYLYGTLPSSSNVYKNCASEGLPPDWTHPTSIEVDSAGGAATGLKSENSLAETLGTVIQPSLPTALGDVAFAIDWWRIRITNQVSRLGYTNLLSLCYNDPQFRAGGSYCAYSSRDANGFLTVEDNYVNIATQVAEGVDYNLRYTHEIGVGELTTDLRATRYLRQDSNLLPTDPLDKYNGTILSPKWVGDVDVKFKRKSWTYYYSMSYIGSMDSNAYLGVGDPATNPYDFAVPSYLIHSASVKYTSTNKWSVILGVRNLTDIAPRTVSVGYYDRVGNGLLYSGYDYVGRSAYLTFSKTF